MVNKPSRIDLLELDIDLRLTDLWREAGEITEWNLDVVAAFMRAAYGKGYCDALTEDAPGSLCHDHGSSTASPTVIGGSVRTRRPSQPRRSQSAASTACSASPCAQNMQLLTCASIAASRVRGRSRAAYLSRVSP